MKYHHFVMQIHICTNEDLEVYQVWCLGSKY